MKKSNAQAERPSNRAGLLRASRPRTEVFEQNDLASSVVHYVLAVYNPNFFLFFNRLQAQAHSNRRGQPRLSRPFFFIFLIR